MIFSAASKAGVSPSRLTPSLLWPNSSSASKDLTALRMGSRQMLSPGEGSRKLKNNELGLSGKYPITTNKNCHLPNLSTPCSSRLAMCSWVFLMNSASVGHFPSRVCRLSAVQ